MADTSRKTINFTLLCPHTDLALVVPEHGFDQEEIRNKGGSITGSVLNGSLVPSCDSIVWPSGEKQGVTRTTTNHQNGTVTVLVEPLESS